MDAERKRWMPPDKFIREIIQYRPSKSTDFRLPTVRNQQVTGSSRVVGSYSRLKLSAVRRSVGSPFALVAGTEGLCRDRYAGGLTSPSVESVRAVHRVVARPCLIVLHHHYQLEPVAEYGLRLQVAYYRFLRHVRWSY